MDEIRTIDSFKEYIKRRLGGGILKVELTDEHLQDAVRNAFRWFTDRKGLVSTLHLTILNNVSEYILPDNVFDVIEVRFVFKDLVLRDDFGFYYGLPFFGGVVYGTNVPRFTGHMFSYSALVQWFQYFETAKRILSSEKDFEYWRDEHKLIIMPVPNETQPALCVIKKEIEDSDFGRLNARDLDLILRYGVADAKEMLGRIRSKFDAIPTAAGDRTLDGDRLLTEAAEEKEKLEVRIAETDFPIPFIVG